MFYEFDETYLLLKDIRHIHTHIERGIEGRRRREREMYVRKLVNFSVDN